MVPLAGIGNADGISITRSGLIRHPAGKIFAGGLSFASPSGAPLSAQVEMMAISSGLKRRSLAKCPYFGSANHGGIICVTTAALSALAHGRVSAKVSSDIGATSPGRWHSWQFFCRTGRTSLLKVTLFEAANAATPRKQPAIEMLEILIRSCLLGIRSTGTHCISPEGRMGGLNSIAVPY